MTTSTSCMMGIGITQTDPWNELKDRGYRVKHTLGQGYFTTVSKFYWTRPLVLPFNKSPVSRAVTRSYLKREV